MEKIIIAVDFSAASNNAAEYGVRLARSLHAKVVLVHAWRPSPLLSRREDLLHGYAISHAIQALESEKERLISLCGTAEISVMAGDGSVISVVRNAVEQTGAEMVIAGMTGVSSGIYGKFFGSSALAFARELPVPVFLVPATAQYHEIGRICFGADLDLQRDSVTVHLARAFAAQLNAELEVVNVVIGVGEKCAVEHHGAILREVFNGISHSTVIIHNDDAADSIAHFVNRQKCDLVMLHPHEHGLFKRFFHDDTATSLASKIQVPLVLIH